MSSMTYTEFRKWVWLLTEWYEAEAPPTRREHYLAQIAAETHRTRTSQPGNVSIKQKFLDFSVGGKAQHKDTRIQQSKNYWGALAAHGQPPHVKKRTQQRQQEKRGGMRKRKGT